MASFDRQDTYHCITVADVYQKYLKFYWNSKIYMYRACPMGLYIILGQLLHMDSFFAKQRMRKIYRNIENCRS